MCFTASPFSAAEKATRMTEGSGVLEYPISEGWDLSFSILQAAAVLLQNRTYARRLLAINRAEVTVAGDSRGLASKTSKTQNCGKATQASGVRTLRLELHGGTLLHAAEAGADAKLGEAVDEAHVDHARYFVVRRECRTGHTATELGLPRLAKSSHICPSYTSETRREIHARSLLMDYLVAFCSKL